MLIVLLNDVFTSQGFGDRDILDVIVTNQSWTMVCYYSIGCFDSPIYRFICHLHVVVCTSIDPVMFFILIFIGLALMLCVKFIFAIGTKI